MKNIVIILRHVITPLILCIFLILGFTAAMLSGVIEYNVIKELFSTNDIETLNLYIPLTIVIVLEGLKLFLHYTIPAHKRIGDTGNHLIFKHLIKYVLVIFSLLCTVIYVSNSLYSPETVINVTDKAIETIKSEHKLELDNSIKLIKKDASQRINNEKTNIENIRSQLKQLTPVYRPKSAYENYIKEKLRLESELKEAENNFNIKYNEIIDERNTKISQLKEENLIKVNDEINSIYESFDYASAGDNKYLSSALKFIISLFGSNEYSRSMYYICVFGISLIVSIMLELAITFTQYYLALNGAKLTELFSDTEAIPDSLKRNTNRIIKVVVQACLMLSIYLIYKAFSKTITTSEEIFFAFASYLLSIIFTSERFKLSLNINSTSNYDSKVYNNIVKAKNLALPVVVQTLMCIVGFLLLSVYMGYNLSELIPTTIALSIGSISGQVILKPKSA